jgi:hypothetical protein
MGRQMRISRDSKLWSVATRLFVSVITFAIGIAVYLFSNTPRTAPTLQQPPPLKVEKVEVTADIGTLKRDIQEAKARGENTVEIGVIGCGAAIGSLREELSRDTIVLADLVGKKTYADTFGLRTWYRFKTRETLVEHPTPRYLAGQFHSGPADMLPIAEDEFLLEEANGQMVIDGVTVTQHSNGAKFLEGQTYLLFLWIDPTTRTAALSASDPFGVFLVDNNGNLSPYIDQPYPFRTALAKRFNNSVNELRQYLKK